MNTSDLKRHYKCKTRRDLSSVIGYSEVTLWKWTKQGIPLKTQAFIEIKTQGRLKADLEISA